MAFRELVCEDGIGAEVYLSVITGTHSAGKSTVAASLSDPEFAERFGVAIDDPYSLMPSYSGSLLPDTQIPIVTVEEAMTAYARIKRLPELATTGYTYERQILVEAQAENMILEAAVIAARLAAALQPDSPLRKAIVFADRCALDGVPYSRLRTEEDQENVDLSRLELVAVGWDSRPGAKNRVLPLREWSRKFMSNYCDIAFVADHREVALEDNGFRLADVEFREEVADLMQSYYREVLGDRVTLLQGTPDERKVEVIRKMQLLV